MNDNIIKMQIWKFDLKCHLRSHMPPMPFFITSQNSQLSKKNSQSGFKFLKSIGGITELSRPGFSRKT